MPGQPTCFSQRDPRWADIHLGTGQETLGQAGCLISCIASALCDVAGYDTDPGRLNRWLARHDGFARLNHFVFASVAPLEMALQDVIPCPGPAPMDKIVATLNAQGAVIAKVDFEPNDRAVQQHWVRVLELSGEDCIIMDPWLLPGCEVYYMLPRYARHDWANAAIAILHLALYLPGVQAQAEATQERLSIRP